KQLEAAQGSLVLPANSDTITSTFLDPKTQLFTDGLGFFDKTGATGPGLDPGNDPTNRTQLVEVGHLGKANGLGAVALLADNAPVQIGNRAWYDTDKDGLQDAGEPSLPGVS